LTDNVGKSKQFNLLMVRDDGSRVLRLSVPGWVVAATVGGLAVTLVCLAFIYPDYVSLRHQRGAFTALSARVQSQQVLLDASQSRLREIRGEIDSWRGLHTKIWEPFGPEAGPAKRGTGIGGGNAGATTGAEDRAPVREEMDRLLGIVKEEGESIRSLERFLGRASRVLASLPSRWPVRGPVNSDFGQRRSPWAPNSEFHSGIDIGASVGMPVKAPAPGVVIFAGQQPEYGVTLILDHGNDTRSLYGHLSKVNVAMDHQVRRGDTVALTGNTGRSSGPHLHYEIQVKGQPVNPHSYIWEESGPAVAKSGSR
jgi:murein DD-endopeptidase MepM/ murein hydrolase activator NlpD